MKTLQKYILSLLMVLSTVSMYAMDGREYQTSNLQSIVAKQGQAELEQASNLQHIVATQASEKASKKLNLQSDILSVDLLKNEILEFLVGSSGRDQNKKPYFTFTIDRKIRPWLLIDKQHGAIVEAVTKLDYKRLEQSCGLLDIYTSLFVSPKAPKSSDFIKNRKNNTTETLFDIAVNNIKFVDDRSIKKLDQKIIKLLLDSGLEINSWYKTKCNSDRTVLHAAASSGNTKALAVLLACNLENINALDGNKITPFYLALKCCLTENVKMLITHGANIDITDNDGKLPEDCTTNPEIKALIVQTRIDRAQKAALENQNKKDL